MNFLKFLFSKSFLKQLGIAFGFIIILIMTISFWLDETTNHTQRIKVPTLVNKTLAEATKEVDDQHLRMFIIDSSKYNPTFKKGVIIEQNPDADGYVKENRQIYVKVNPKGYKNVQLPEINKLTKRNAVVILRSVGLKVGDHPIYVRDIARDIVRGVTYKGKKIKSSELLPRNAIVELILGDGKATNN